MPTKMPQPLGAVMSVVRFAVRHGLMPDPKKALEKSHDERLAMLVPRLFCKPGPDVLTEDVVVDGRGGPIPARVYRRADAAAGAPGILFIHGGAFMQGGVDFCDNVQRGLAHRTGAVVLGLSYRLAPDHPFPAALDDCVDVVEWMARTRPGGMDPDRIAIGGESAGGNLTVAVCLWARDHGGPRIAHQSVYYPFTDCSLRSADWDNRNLMPGVDRAAGELMVKLYGGDRHADPLVNVCAADLHGLPPTTVITCGHDVLREDGFNLAASLKAAGVETLHTHYDDMPHGFLMFSRLTSRADESMDEMARETGKRFAALLSNE
ncbi:MAG TPA: alpha/beta hydrolase [Mycobacteriales bacterium]|nr:alpha/beta hydrolase [Mycobacteriales bacterium]